MAQLKRILELPMLTFYGTGMILGAGIYSIIGKAAGIAGESVWLSLLIAAIAALLAALSYAELSAMYPKVGGEYIYLRHALPEHRWIANTTGLMMAFAGIAAASTVSLAFGGYLEQVINISPMFVAFLLILFFTLINIFGLKESSWMNVAFTLIEVFGLIWFIYFGINSPDFGKALLAEPSVKTISASSLIIFAYFGFENIINFAEETKNPEKTLPRAILLSILISAVLYILVSLSAVSLLPINELALSNAPIADAVRPISKSAAGALVGIALFATANTVLISLLTTSRILLGLSRDKVVPSFFAQVHKKRQTPWLAAIVVFLLAILLLPLNKIETLASISSFSTMLAFILVHLALVVLRIRNPSQSRPFRVPLSIGKVPILAILGGVSTVLLLLQFDATVYRICGGILFLIIISQLFWQSHNKINK